MWIASGIEGSIELKSDEGDTMEREVADVLDFHSLVWSVRIDRVNDKTSTTRVAGFSLYSSAGASWRVVLVLSWDEW